MTVLSTRVLCVTLVAVLHAMLVEAFPQYRARIPNGFNVPGVPSVGHKNKEGSGPLNAFGEAFDKAGETWTKELCQQDSDGDGLTNGQELGDPCCEWSNTTGNTMLRTTDLTNPGDANSVSNAAACAAGSGSSHSSLTGGNATNNKQSQTTAQPPNTSGNSSSTPLFLSGMVGLVCGMVMVTMM